MQRTHWADTDREAEHLLNRLVAQNEHVEKMKKIGSRWVIITTRPANARLRAPAPGSLEFRDWAAVGETGPEKPVVIDEEAIAKAAARWDDPA